MRVLATPTRIFSRPVPFQPWQWLRAKYGWEGSLFILFVLLALGLRLWELDGRAMHYDEALHVHYGWRLAQGEGYSHSPWMHGPFQVHFTALIFKIFGDSDFIARLGYAFFGAALVGLPYFLRGYLGRAGALTVSLLLVVSPTLLYFSRFGRNEIIMAFWAVALLILMWRYLNEGKNRYLYLASAVLALAFATKETAYILVLIFGAFFFLMSLTELIPWTIGRLRLSDLRGPAALLVLLVTLTLPQWSALLSIPLNGLGVQLVSEGVGDVGLPVWGEPFISFPIIRLHWALDIAVLTAMVIVPLGAILDFRTLRRRIRWLVPVAILALLIYAFVSFANGIIARDYLISFGILFTALIVSTAVGIMWCWRVWLVCAGIFYFIWAGLYTSVFGLFVQHHGYCPAELGGFYSNLCGRLGGLFTGSWQGMGYWLTQQDVARGGQPWYYYLLLGSTYEFLPFLVAIVAVFYYLRKGEMLGLMLVFWSLLSLAAYTVAGEKMPWLIVNIAVPFLLLAGKFIGDIIEGVHWQRLLPSVGPRPHLPASGESSGPDISRRGELISHLRRYGSKAIASTTQLSPIILFVLTPVLVIGGFYLLLRILDHGSIGSAQGWAILSGELLLLVGITYLVLKWPTQQALRLGGLGLGIIVLAFSIFVGFRASYSDNDSPVEMLVYAQGSADVRKMAKRLNDQIVGKSEVEQIVDVDYELWYPFQWYVRDKKAVGFRCFKDTTEDGWIESCSPLEEPPSAKALLLFSSHATRDDSYLDAYEKVGPFRNILWFPESYRRSGENRRQESMATQLNRDFQYFRRQLVKRESWHNALDYFLFRRLGNDWWNSEFYAYFPKETQS